MEKVKAQDILAAIIIIGGMGLLFCGKDGTVATLLLAVTAFYFGLKSEEPNSSKR